MKKLVTIATAAGMLAFIACGPSAEEKAKAQHMKDSLTADSTMKATAMQAKVMQMRNDSMKMVQMKADSMKRADSMKNAPAPAMKGKKKK